ncbi:MAG: cation:proton antiporter [Oligoflexia bacterium]|nr:cation:proton antiporter [Oligoflexia bacterium]
MSILNNVDTFPAALALCLFLIYYLGNLFVKLGQPRVMGEIAVGLILGPSFLGLFFNDLFVSLFNSHTITNMNFLKELGLILLMFCSGYELRHLNPQKYLKICLIGVLMGIGLPAIFGFLLFNFIDISSLIGIVGSIEKLKFILILSMAVTSIPVISRILMDLDLLKTSFSKMVLSIALVEDLILYTFLNALLSAKDVNVNLDVGVSMLAHLFVSAGFLLIVIFFREKIYNIAEKFTFGMKLEAYQYLILVLALLFSIVFLASLGGIVSMLSALGCGMILGSGSSLKIIEMSEVIRKFSFSIFIPMYFVMVGFKINLAQDFSLYWLLIILATSSFFKILGGFLAGKFSCFSNLKSIILGITLNARGGPGIVIATAALETNIINSVLFTTLIFTALLTSSFAGVVLKKFRTTIQNDM